MKLIFVCVFLVIAVCKTTVAGESIADIIYLSELVTFMKNPAGNPNYMVISNKELLKAEVTYEYLSQKYNRVKFDNTTFDLLDPSLPVKFIIQGWSVNTDSQFIDSISQSYLSVQDYNIILVYWISKTTQAYPESAYLTMQVGNMVADMIYQINQQTAITLNTIHIIGHSLGGQIAGFAGKHIQALTNGLKVPRITALDPGGPYFFNATSTERLTETDADMVDVTHSDGGYYGYGESCGTVDFFPNGGTRFQPGCSSSLYFYISALLNQDLTGAIFCSDSRSYYYFNATIKGTILMGTECDSEASYNTNSCSGNQQILYGDQTPPSARGNYYFNTNNEAPYVIV